MDSIDVSAINVLEKSKVNTLPANTEKMLNIAACEFEEFNTFHAVSARVRSRHKLSFAEVLEREKTKFLPKYHHLEKVRIRQWNVCNGTLTTVARLRFEWNMRFCL